MRPGVLLVGNFLSATRRAGSFTVCEELAGRLVRAGWPVITTSAKCGRLSRLCDMVRTVWKRRREYAVAQVDVYSGAAFIWAEAACMALRRAQKPCILTLHGGGLPAFAQRWPGRVRRLLRTAQAVTAPSCFLFERMQPYGKRLTLLPNGLDIAGYPFRLRDAPAPSLVWLRAFHEIYNPALAVRVLALLLPRYPLAHLTMGGADKGDGALQRTLREAEALCIADHIRLPGCVPKSEVWKSLDSADIFLNTTNVDNTPVSVLEAMACGLCVVSTNAGGLPYLLEDGEDALLVPPDDAPTMARAVGSLLENHPQAKKLSRSGRTKVEAFDWSIVLPQWEKLILSLAGSGRASGENDG